jgi:uncharacterized protein
MTTAVGSFGQLTRRSGHRYAASVRGGSVQFNVSELLREGYGSFREHDIDDDVRLDGQAQHLTGHVRFDRVPEGVLVRATIHGGLHADCSRCLEPVTLPIDLTIEEQYIPTIDPMSGARVVPPEGEEDAYRISERHVIDLAVPVQHYWTMARPIAPICREDCAGLCPVCGLRREGRHGCIDEPVDDRWSRLRDLKLG